MALRFISGFETGDFSEWMSWGGPVSVQGTIKKTGDFAMRCNASNETAFISSSPYDRMRISFYLYIASAPSDQCIILGAVTGGNIQLTNDRYLKLYDGAVLKDTSSTQLNLEQWYRICLAIDTVNDNAKAYLDGVEELASMDNSFLHRMYPSVGVITAVTADLYFDDCITDYTDSIEDLGDMRVLLARLTGAGQYAEFDTISGYDKCDEVPANDADFVDDSGVSVLHRECYNLQDSSVIGLVGSDIIKAVMVWARGYDSGASAQGIFVRDNGVDYKTLTLWGNAFTWKNKLYDINAPRGSAWTQAIFDAFQAGGYSEGSKDVYISCVMVTVAFIPEEAPPPGWTGKVSGVTNPAKVMGVPVANIAKVKGVT